MTSIGYHSRSAMHRQRTPCRYWLLGCCKYGDRCWFWHPQSHGRVSPATIKKEPAAKNSNGFVESGTRQALFKEGDGFVNLAKLDGHKKDVTGIALPSGSDKLYTASRDGTMRLWDCMTGKCVSVRNLGGEIGCLMSEGTWVFAGLRNVIKAWNVAESSGAEAEPICLEGPMGLVNTIEADDDLLFAGVQDGSVLTWRGSMDQNNPFKLVASLKGHTKAVLCLRIGRNRLYSASMDHTVRVWDPKSFSCLYVLEEHTDGVTSLLCWENCLLTCSLDKTIKAWALTEDGRMIVVHTHQEDQGLIALDGMHDSESKPVLFCSRKDNSVRMYELPSFNEKGKILSRKEVKAIYTGPSNLFFTGDGTGGVAVWTWLTHPSKGPA